MKPQALPGVGGATERDPLDFNRTPAWVVQLLVPHLGQPKAVLDLGCGDGAIGRALRHAWPNAAIYGIEIDRHRADASDAARTNGAIGPRVYDEVWLADAIAVPGATYAATPWRLGADLIIANPPFGLPALQFLERALGRLVPHGQVAFLLPTHWDHDPDVESDFARQRCLDGLRLPDGREGYAKLEIVGGGPYPARPSFKKGGTASDRYAWYMFGEKWAGQPSRRIHAIPPAVESGQVAIGGIE